MKIKWHWRITDIHSFMNWLCFVVGMIGVYWVSHSWLACLWAFVASLHFRADGKVQTHAA